MNGSKIPISQEFLFYKGTVGNNAEWKNRSSGAYIFRPNGTDPYAINEKVEFKVFEGDLVSEVHQVFNDWLAQTIRIYGGENHVEFDWIVGPLPWE